MFIYCAESWCDSCGERMVAQLERDFRPLTSSTANLSTHDGCTVGENAGYLTPGEWLASDGVLIEFGG